MISARSPIQVWQTLQHCNFLSHCNCDKHLALYSDTTYLTLPSHTTFSDHDDIPRSQQLSESCKELYSWVIFFYLI